MPSSRRLVKLLDLLHAKGGMEAAELARACGISTRTLQRDMDALTAAGFPVYFDHGYRLAMPALLPAIPLTVDEALALRVAAQAALPRTEAAAARALSLASDKLQQTLTATPPVAPGIPPPVAPLAADMLLIASATVSALAASNVNISNFLRAMSGVSTS